ncbi:MAG TPA: GNAT family N-acetyltransferase, partial [Solirubrobacteraceae bacterium]|nr:GNAT family N-acetyltransferase [Solirubrobacteraceae bacterium]
MPDPPPLHTERLTLDRWTEADNRLLGDLARTPAVMRYVGDGTTWSDARIHGVGAHVVAHWAEHGFGWRVARCEGAAVGLIALNFAGEGAGIAAGEYEIGWWLAPDAWGRGLAREGAAALRDEAFTRVGAP